MSVPTRSCTALLAALVLSMPAAAQDSDWRRANPEDLIELVTSKGVILIEIAPGFAENHARQIRSLVRSGRYNGTLFHRVIEGFMAQGGDVRATPDGEAVPRLRAEFVFRRDPQDHPVNILGDPNRGARDGFVHGFPIRTQPEFLAEITEDGRVDSWMRHCPGVASMARAGDPHSAASQFFLLTGAAPWLDRQYTAWGRVVDGLDVVEALNIGQPPETADMLIRARMVADLPPSERPSVYIERTDSKRFRAKLARGQGDICALPPVETRIEQP